MMQRIHKGFTLIEVIIVIALVGVLSTAMIMIINPLQQFKKARDVERKSDLRQIQAALELYRSDNAAYPAALPNCDAAFTGTSGATYLQKLPCDPVSNIKYTYALNGNTYTLVGCLENTNDPQKDGTNSCTATGRWSFTVTNP
jgi:general secretion pathway protein G